LAHLSFTGRFLNNSNITIAGTFSAFRHYNYRLWFAGQLVSLIGTWMQNTAQGYLVYTLTGSAAYLGLLGFVSGVPSWLFMLYGGVVADRVPRRTLMMITQSVMMVLAFVLAGLVFANVVQPWHIMVLAFLLGVTNAFDMPARQSFVLEMVSREDMTNAIAMNATMFNAGVIIGPAIAGVTYAAFGPAWCFMINGLSFIAVIIALAMMHIKPLPPVRRASAITALKDSLQYVKVENLVQTLIISVLVLNVFGFGLITLMPAWAVSVLGGDVTTNGLLLSARGIGAVIGGLSIAALGGRKRGKMWTISSFVLPLVLIAFAAARWLPLSLVLMAGMGFALIAIMNNSNAMVQHRVPDDLRGRVMGLYSLMMMGGLPIGSLMIGVLAERTSEPAAVVAGAVVLLIFASWIYLRRPAIRQME
jgi:MFS family permease